MTATEPLYTVRSAEAPLPRFSWRRIMQLAQLYRRPIRTQWLIYAIATPAIYIGMVFLPYGFKALFGLLLSLMTIAGPLVFCRRDNTLVLLAPVTGAERLTFYLLYSFIVVPGGIELYFLILQGIATLFSPEANVHTILLNMAMASPAQTSLTMGQTLMFGTGSVGMTLLVLGAVLYGALFGRNPVKAAILYGAGAYGAMMLAVIIYAFVLGFMAARSLPAGAELDPYQTGLQAGNDFVAQMPMMMVNIGVTSLGLCAIMCVKMYRRLR